MSTVDTSEPYVLRIRNCDWTGGLGTLTNQGETVTSNDFNGVATSLGVNNAVSYWKDLNGSGAVDTVDLSIITAHLNHNCTAPTP